MLNNTEQIFDQINKANKIAIVFNKNMFGDNLAAALASFLFVKKLNKQVDIIVEKNSNNHSFNFLPSIKYIKTDLDKSKQLIISLNTSQTQIEQIKYKKLNQEIQFAITPKTSNFTAKDISIKVNNLDYDLIITIGCPDLASLGNLYQQYTDFFFETTIINIDNQASNDNYGQINLVNLNDTAICETLFSLFTEYNDSFIDEDIATCLLTGIIAKTKSFKAVNITPQALLTASKLIEIGARREEIIDHLYRNKNVNILQLWGKTLSNLKSSLDSKFIWSVLEADDFLNTKTTPADLENIIDELIISIPQAMIVMLVIQDTNNKSKVLIHSIKNIDSLELVKEYKPQGDKHLAEISINNNLNETSQKLSESIISKLKEMNL